MWLGPLLIALTLFGISRLFGAQPLAAIYREKFPETPRERLFWSSLGFFVAVAVVRTLTFLIHNQIGPFHDIALGAGDLLTEDLAHRSRCVGFLRVAEGPGQARGQSALLAEDLGRDRAQALTVQ